MSEEHTAPVDETEARRERIRGWYAEAKATGVSDSDFFREMSTLVSLEDLEDALDIEPEPERPRFIRPPA